MNKFHTILLSTVTCFALCCQAWAEPRRVVVHNYQDVLALFEELGYTPEHWQSGVREIPRIEITDIPELWQQQSASIPVDHKKNIFLRLIGPGVLLANEKIQTQRSKMLQKLEATHPETDPWLVRLAIKYKVIRKADSQLSKADLSELKQRVDIIPVSLSLAQSAEESGWGTSRFSVEGNALFGQWDFSGNGMKPRKQRKSLGNYGIARFDSPQHSIEAYIHNLNTHRAYRKLRQARAAMRGQGIEPNGWELAKTLDKYSERGYQYVKTLHTIMRQNKLAAADETRLWKKELIIVSPASTQ